MHSCCQRIFISEKVWTPLAHLNRSNLLRLLRRGKVTPGGVYLRLPLALHKTAETLVWCVETYAIFFLFQMGAHTFESVSVFWGSFIAAKPDELSLQSVVGLGI